METNFRVLSDTDRDQVHDKTVKILAETGVRVESDLGRDYLKKAGAEVDENTKMRELRRTIDAIGTDSAKRCEVVCNIADLRIDSSTPVPSTPRLGNRFERHT